MTENPYAPPAAPVAEVVGDESRQRPKQITWAVWILSIASLIVLAPGLLLLLFSLIDDGPFPIALVGIYFGFACIAFGVIRGISKGKNWARIVLICSYVLVILTVIIALRVSNSRMGIVDTGVLLVQIALHACACALLFLSAGKEWFVSEVRGEVEG